MPSITGPYSTPSLPGQVTVSSSKYGFSQTVSRDFPSMLEQLKNGQLQSRGGFRNAEGKLPAGNYTEYELPTLEMNLPNGVAGPERLLTGEAGTYYTGNHYEDFINVRTGAPVGGEEPTFYGFMPVFDPLIIF